MHLPELTKHFLSFWDAVLSSWKAISVVCAGAFGILGLLTDFKKSRKDAERGKADVNERKQITKWGYVSLIGILASTIFGVAAQQKEADVDAKKALALAMKADRTLNDIERSLYLLADPTISVSIRVPCNDHVYEKFCVFMRRQGIFKDIPASRINGWPINREIMALVEVYPNLPPGWNHSPNGALCRNLNRPAFLLAMAIRGSGTVARI
jgi:hypothetical protein